MQCETFANNEKGLKEFINRAMEMKDYPTMKEYLRYTFVVLHEIKYIFCLRHFQETTDFCPTKAIHHRVQHRQFHATVPRPGEYVQRS